MSNAKRIGRTVFQILLALILLAALCAGLAYFGIKNYNKAFDPDNSASVKIVIEKGSYAASIGIQLEEAGIIDSATVFRYKARFNELGSKFQAGTYYLSPSMTMNELMETLQNGKNPEVAFTVPEGLTLTEVAQTLKDEGLISDVQDFYDALEDDYDFDFLPESGTAVGTLSAKANRLEGYLYPETYRIAVGSDAHAIITRMLTQFQESVITDEILNNIPDGYTLNQIIALASIVEQETGVDSERDRIAGVFWNRLKIGQRLESCATVNYFRGDQDFSTSLPSPFNTYLHAGITPGPICSPSLKSIMSTINPESHSYYYFVLKGDGSHTSYFAKTYEEHLKNVAKYQSAPYDY